MASDIEQRIDNLEARVTELEGKINDIQIMPSESDLEEFLRSVDPGTHVERVTTIGYYFTHETSDEAPFTVKDVEKAYENCRIPKPANLSDVLAGAEDRGWLVRTGTKGQSQLWQVSQEGDKAAAQEFQQ